jgi:hypothetical protein
MLPKHFGPGARRAYPGVYKERTLQWLKRKMRIATTEIRLAMNFIQPKGKWSKEDTKEYWREYWRAADRIVQSKGGVNYLVHTGTLQQLSRLATFRAFPSRASIQIRGTAYTPLRPKSVTQPNIRAELTATTNTERNQLRVELSKTIRAGLRFYSENGHVPPTQRQGIFQ